MYKNNPQKDLKRINHTFYHLITDLKMHQFKFCAYLVEEAYKFYMTELERRLK